jgi:hypothetical protein
MADLEYVRLILMTPLKKLLNQVRDAIRLKQYSENKVEQPRLFSRQISHDRVFRISPTDNLANQGKGDGLPESRPRSLTPPRMNGDRSSSQNPAQP